MITNPIPYLQVEHLHKSVGNKVLFSDLSFGVNKGERIALVARNGIGKSTLMDILSGGGDYDSGRITWRKDLRVHYLPQNLPVVEGEETLSGGQKKWNAISRVLDNEPDMLLLDEPTNHLDLAHVIKLEETLRKTNTTLLMVTHDRYFLDNVCDLIIELDEQGAYTYQGTYSYYLEKRAERIENLQQETQRAKNLYRTELEWMRRMPQARAHKAQYRIDSFYELEKKAHRTIEDKSVKLEVQSGYIGNKIFEAKHITKVFDADQHHQRHVILDDFSYIFSRYEKLGIIGGNGTGKSTFLRLLLGELQPDSGTIEIGQTIRFGYYSQSGLPLMNGKKVIDLIRDIAETIDMGNGERLTASQFLQHFLFSPQQQYDYVDKLSGGERRRLHLCMVLMKNPNFLILDEPTNDLDIPTLQVLEEYLCNFRGCVIVVSHDRYFMDKVVDHLFVFQGQGQVQDFPGNYTQYRAWEKEQSVPKQDKPKNVAKPVGTSVRARKLTFKEKQELESLEKMIPQLEENKQDLENQLSGGLTSADEIAAASREYEEVSARLDEAEMRWLELSELDK